MKRHRTLMERIAGLWCAVVGHQQPLDAPMRQFKAYTCCRCTTTGLPVRR